MEYTQGYGLIVIKFENKKPYLSPASADCNMKKVLADALEFVKLYVKDDISLQNVNGFNFVLHPNMSLRELVNEYEEKLMIRYKVQQELADSNVIKQN